MFFNKLAGKKEDSVKFDVISKTNEEEISVTYGCIRFIDSLQFPSNSFDSLNKSPIDIIYETLLEKKIVGDDSLLHTIYEIETLISEDRTVEDLKTDFLDEIEN